MLRCGVGTPEGYDQFAACQTVNGVDWFVPEDQIEDQDADVVMTTIGRVRRRRGRGPCVVRPPGAPYGRPRPAIKAAHAR